MNELIIIRNTRGYMGENGVVNLNLEDVARGLGFVKRDYKDGKVYERIHKQNISKWLFAFGLLKSESDALPEFIPENIFYKLCFKASNPTAREFQDLVTDEILPTIRRTGGYVANDELFIATYFPHADESTKQMLRLNLAAMREANKKVDMLETKLNESEKYWTIMKFNQTFNLCWDMKTCQHNGKAASVYSRQHGYEIRKCQTNDERFKETNSYAYEVLETLFLPQKHVRQIDCAPLDKNSVRG